MGAFGGMIIVAAFLLSGTIKSFENKHKVRGSLKLLGSLFFVLLAFAVKD